MLQYLTPKRFKKDKTAQSADDDDEVKAKAPEAEKHDKGVREEGDHTKHHHHGHREGISPDENPTSPVLDENDQEWLERILADDSPAPPLPPRSKTPDYDWGSDMDASSVNKSINDENESKSPEDANDSKGKGKAADDLEKTQKEKKPNRFSLLFTRKKTHGDTLTPEDDVPPKEAERETKDLGNVLDRLNLAAKNNKVVSLSNESSELLQKFTQIFKDLVNGVPTAYGDLTGLIDDRDGALAKGYEKLPSSLKKLVTQLPNKLTSSLAPELLAVAAESQGIRASSGEGVKGTAKNMFKPQNIADLVTKPGALVGMLKAIVNALRVRWPAFIGTNVLWSVALFCKLFSRFLIHTPSN